MSLPSLGGPCPDDLQQWLDGIPFSRVRKSIARDFSDGVLVAEIVAHYLPRYAELNAFMPASAVALKRYNWETLNRKVFTKLNFQVPVHLIDGIVACKTGSIEFVLANLRTKIELALKNYGRNGKRYTGKRSSSEAGSTTSFRYASSVGGSTLSISSGSSFVESRNDHMAGHGAITASCTKLQLDDLVPSELLYLAQQRELEKEERIQTAEARVRHLEQLVAVKDQRIQYLTQRIDTLLQCVSTLEQKTDLLPSANCQLLLRTPAVNGEDCDECGERNES